MSTEKAMVCRFEVLPSKRFVGYKFNPYATNSSGKVSGAYEQLTNAVEVPYMPEYIKALKCGDLLAVDADTAKLAGLKL